MDNLLIVELKTGGFVWSHRVYPTLTEVIREIDRQRGVQGYRMVLCAWDDMFWGLGEVAQPEGISLTEVHNEDH